MKRHPIDPCRRTVTVRASVVAGRLDVVVPTDATVVVAGTISAGSADLFGVHRDGNDVPLGTLNPGDPGSGTIRLDLGTTYGYVHVDQPATQLGIVKPLVPSAAKAPLAPKQPSAPTAPIG